MTTRLSKQTNRTRASFIRRLKDWGDEEGYKQLYEQFWPTLYGLALQKGLRHDEAEEVVQETFITIAKTMPKFRYDSQRGYFRGFLLKTARWRIQDQWRKRPRQGVSERPSQISETKTGILEAIPDPAGNRLEIRWDRESKQDLIHTALARLKGKVSPKQFQIFDLYVVKGWSAKKVSQFLGVSMGTVFLAKCRLLPWLKKELQVLRN